MSFHIGQMTIAQYIFHGPGYVRTYAAVIHFTMTIWRQHDKYALPSNLCLLNLELITQPLYQLTIAKPAA